MTIRPLDMKILLKHRNSYPRNLHTSFKVRTFALFFMVLDLRLVKIGYRDDNQFFFYHHMEKEA